MIIKKIENPKKSATKKQRITALIRYILSDKNQSEQTKCSYAKAKNFIFSEQDFELCLMEMIALSQEAVRAKDTVNHYVFSWKTEVPTLAQVDDCVNVLLQQLEMQNHQVIYALHSDTDHAHLHIAVNKVHPDTLKVKSDFQDIHPMHKAVAILDDKYQFQAEENALYTLENNQLIYHQKTADKTQPKVKQRNKDKEVRTGEKSAQRIAIEQINAVINQAKTWQEFHSALARQGMRYEKKGSGALIYVNEIAVKASSASRHASLSALQKKWGEYQPRDETQLIQPRKPEPTITIIKTHAIDYWQLYQTQQARLKTEREALKKKRNECAQQLNQKKQQLVQQFIADKQRIYAKNLSRKNQKAAIGFLAYYFALEKSQIDQQIKNALADFKQQNPSQTLPKFSTWKEEFIRLNEKQKQPKIQNTSVVKITENLIKTSEQDEQEDDDTFNYESIAKQIKLEQQLAAFLKHQLYEIRAKHEYDRNQQILKTITAFSAKQVGGSICYYDLQGNIKFADMGNKVVMAEFDKESLLAMMQLSDAKFGEFVVFGSDEFKLACAEIAAEYHFKIVNPELQDFIMSKRQRLNNQNSSQAEDEGDEDGLGMR